MKFFFLATALLAVFTPLEFNRVLESALKNFKLVNGRVTEGINSKTIAAFNVEKFGDFHLYSPAEFKKKYPAIPDSFTFKKNHLAMVNVESGYVEQVHVLTLLKNMQEAEAKNAAVLASEAEKAPKMSARQIIEAGELNDMPNGEPIPAVIESQGLVVAEKAPVLAAKQASVVAVEANQIPVLDVFQEDFNKKNPEIFEFYHDLLQNQPIGRGIRKPVAAAIGAGGVAIGGIGGWSLKGNTKQSSR
jgi:hypothetical protein